MPDHLHAVVELGDGFALAAVMRTFGSYLDSAIVRAPRASSQVLRQGGELISAQAYLRYVEHEIREADAA